MKFVFVHGWGYDASFWRPLIEALKPDDYGVVDFGYLGADPVFPDDKDAIYITHSMGTLWALSERRAHMRALVSLNGFSHFGDFFDARIVQRMRRRLGRDAAGQMADFWDLCGFVPDHGPLHSARLDEGLGWLATWDAREGARHFDRPVLALGGLDDQLCRDEVMGAHWTGCDVSFIEGGTHTMAVHRADLCASYIKAFLDGIRVEDKS